MAFPLLGVWVIRPIRQRLGMEGRSATDAWGTGDVPHRPATSRASGPRAVSVDSGRPGQLPGGARCADDDTAHRGCEEDAVLDDARYGRQLAGEDRRVGDGAEIG